MCNERAHDHDEDGNRKGCRDRRTYRMRKSLFVFRTEILRRHDAGTDRYAHEQYEQQVDDRAAGADGGQRAVTHIIADHDGVHRAVQLLRQVTDEKRCGKPNEIRRRIAHRHILRSEKCRELSCHNKKYPPRPEIYSKFGDFASI